MPVELVIQTFKNHFIAVCSGMDPNILKQAWNHELEHIVVTLNMLHQSKLNSKISASMQLHGNFDFNKTLLAPAGCKIIIHNRTDNDHLGPITDQEFSMMVQLFTTTEVMCVFWLIQKHSKHPIQLISPHLVCWSKDDPHRNIVHPEVATNTISCLK